jgi:hypothetical protein
MLRRRPGKVKPAAIATIKRTKPEEDLYKTLPLTVFSGHGRTRLHSVECVAEGASNPDDASSNLAVAICYDGGAIVVSSSTKSPDF